MFRASIKSPLNRHTLTRARARSIQIVDAFIPTERFTSDFSVWAKIHVKFHLPARRGQLIANWCGFPLATTAPPRTNSLLLVCVCVLFRNSNANNSSLLKQKKMGRIFFFFCLIKFIIKGIDAINKLACFDCKRERKKYICLYLDSLSPPPPSCLDG